MTKQPAKSISPIAVDTLFNISKADLFPIVENATQVGPIMDFEIKLTHEKQGHKGAESESVIATFYYKTETASSGEIIMFIKRQHAPEKRESKDYFAFAQVGIPTPKYYGHLEGINGEEILFLEFLPDIGIDLKDISEIREWIGLLAKISATELPFAHFSLPEASDIKKQPADPTWWKPSLIRIWEQGVKGELGEDLQALCAENPHGVSALTDYGVQVEKRAAQMGKELHQGDACIQNVGWRITEAGKEIVVFDLGFSVGQRFYDIGNAMRALRESDISQEVIATHFLAEYAKWSGKHIVLKNFLSDMGWISDIIELWCLPWFLDMSQSGDVDWTDDIEAGKDAFRQWLYEGLTQLLESSKIGQPFYAHKRDQ